MPSAAHDHSRALPGCVPLSVTLMPLRPPLCISSGKPANTARPSSAGGTPISIISWTIYVLVELVSGKAYVGMTRRSLAARIRSHIARAKRMRQIHTSGLTAAIQMALSGGQKFTRVFSVEAVATAYTKVEGQVLERQWIERLGSRLT